MAKPGTDVARPQDLDSGLDDLDQFKGRTVPRLNIEHDKGVFADNLTGETFSELNIVPLGMVGQRVLWPEKLKAGDVPLCRSLDMKQATPAENFPWKASGFEKDDLHDGSLACAGCNLKEW